MTRARDHAAAHSAAVWLKSSRQTLHVHAVDAGHSDPLVRPRAEPHFLKRTSFRLWRRAIGLGAGQTSCASL